MNNSGGVAGTDNSIGGDAFLYANGVLTDVSGEPAYAASVNDEDSVVGTWDFGPNGGDAFLYSNGATTDLSVLWGLGQQTYAEGINDSSDIIGAYGVGQPSNVGGTAFVDYAGGAFVILGASCGGEAMAINSLGEVAVGLMVSGECNTFLYDNGVLTDISTLGQASYPTGINDNGQVVGDYLQGGYYYGFVYSNGVMNDLSGYGIGPVGINNAGQILGNIGDPTVVLLTPVDSAPEPGCGMLVLIGSAVIAVAKIRSRASSRGAVIAGDGRSGQ
jgi:probable HAF family extracellular repeat protein